jgi:hypothetical protein
MKTVQINRKEKLYALLNMQMEPDVKNVDCDSLQMKTNFICLQTVLITYMNYRN